MQLNKKIYIGLMFLLALGACTEAGSEYEEEARERGIFWAKILIEKNKNLKQGEMLETTVLDAKVVQSEYLLIGDTLAAKAFGESYKAYIEANDSILAKEMF